jgi:ornithine cyclodeaminase
MRVVELPEILAALDEEAALAAVEAGFRRYSAGEVEVTAVGHLGFTDPPGDCHVKGAHIAGDDVFVVKLATSFYRNSERGLSSSNGFMAVISAETGEILAMLHDKGQLTDRRTAMAGAIAARAIARPGSATLGIVGAGIQARLQAQLIARVLGLHAVLVWARSGDRAEALAAELGGQAVGLPELCARADLIVTTTPATVPLLTDAMIRPGARIVALGADSPGKQELEAAILGRARIIVDSRAQCVDHGEAGWAVRAGLVDAAALVELGTLLASPVAFRPDDIVVADLTGVAVQDAEIAKVVWRGLRTDGEASVMRA